MMGHGVQHLLCVLLWVYGFVGLWVCGCVGVGVDVEPCACRAARDSSSRFLFVAYVPPSTSPLSVSIAELLRVP